MDSDFQGALFDGLRLILRPIARFCLRHSFKLQEIIECLKLTLIDVAEEDLRREGKNASTSRINIMTGVSRPDVDRLYKKKAAPKLISNQVSRVVGTWQSDARFVTKNGKPRILTVEGMASEFVKLVSSVSGDLNPYTVLFELERIGAVIRTPSGLKLESRHYLPQGNMREGFGLLSRDTTDLIESVEENILKSAPMPNLHLKTEYDKVPAFAVTAIKEWLVENGSAFHRKARQFLSKYDKDLNPHLKDDKFVRVALVSFSRVDDR